MEFDDREFAATAFCVPKAPGRIYVEARLLRSVVRLCNGILNTYIRTMFVVPIAEQVALLSGRGLSDRLIEEGSLCKGNPGGGIRTRMRWRRENLSIYIESRCYCSTYLAEGEPKRSNLRYSPRQRTAIYTTVRMQTSERQILPNSEVE